MSVFKDVIDILRSQDIKDVLSRAGKSKSSLSRLSEDGILQFHTLVDRSIDIDTLQMVTKALERNYSSFAQVVFSMYGTMDVSKTPNAAEFVKMFHQNSDDMGKFASDVIDDLSEAYNIIKSDNIVLMSATYENATSTGVVTENKKELLSLLEQLRTDTVNSKFIPKNDIVYNFKNKSLSAVYNKKNLLHEASNTPSPSGGGSGTQPSKPTDASTIARNLADIKKTKATIKSMKRQAEREDRLDTQKNQEYIKRNADTILYGNGMLRDNDVKKSNELVPTMLHIRVKQINQNNEDVGIIDFMIGIKVIMHPVKTGDMVENIIAACRNNDVVFNFLRWTTGEIKFFKDFMFGIGEIKHDISNKNGGGSPWWTALKRRRALSKMRKAVAINNNLLPNATIVISNDVAELIKSEYGFDLFNPVFVDKIMQTYFLLGFVIVDNASQIVHFMFDGRKDFESVAYSGLERENSRDERKFKEMLKAINRN